MRRVYAIAFICAAAAWGGVPLGRVLAKDGVEAAIMPYGQPPAIVAALMPQRHYGVLVSVRGSDASVDRYAIAVTLETAAGAIHTFTTSVKPAADAAAWVTANIETPPADGAVVRALSFSVTPLQPNQVKSFTAADAKEGN